MAVDPLTEIADTIRQLCEQHHHTEKYDIWTKNRNRNIRHHTAWHPPLIVQLQQAAQPTHQTDDIKAGRHGKPAPAAPANLDALDRLQAIQAGIAHWRATLSLPPRDGLDLHGLVGAAAATDPHTRTQLAADIDRWKLWCLTLAGWRTPPWRPHAPCPQCERMPGDKTGLRVRLDRSTACCLSCGAAWGPDAVGILADHVRGWKDNHHDQTGP